MIDRDDDLPLARQAQLLRLSRSGLYFQPRPVSPEDLALMQRIDELHPNHPFADSRMLRDLARREGILVGREHIRTLMRRMGSKPCTGGWTRPGPSPATRSIRTCCAAW